VTFLLGTQHTQRQQRKQKTSRTENGGPESETTANLSRKPGTRADNKEPEQKPGNLNRTNHHPMGLRMVSDAKEEMRPIPLRPQHIHPTPVDSVEPALTVLTCHRACPFIPTTSLN